MKAQAANVLSDGADGFFIRLVYVEFCGLT